MSSARAVFRNPTFRTLLAAQTVSLAGDSFGTLAIAFGVLAHSSSVGDLGLVLAARTVPLVALVTLGGVIADRWPRRRLLVLTNVARCGSQGLLALMILLDHAPLAMFVACAVLHGAASAVAQPTLTAYLPDAVPRHQLQHANALIAVASSAVAVGGPAAAGLTVAVAGSGVALAVDATTFAVAAVLFACTSTRAAAPGPSRAGGLVNELKTGWAEVRGRRWLWMSIGCSSLLQLGVLGPLLVLGPLVAQESLGGSSTWGWLLAASGAGGVAGGLAALRLRTTHRVLLSALLPLGLAPTLLLLAQPGPVAVLAAAQVVGGAAITMAMTCWETALQHHIPGHLLARVAAYDWLGSTAMRPIGLLLAGPLAATAGVQTTLLASLGVLILTTGAHALVRDVRQLNDHPDPAPAPAPSSGPVPA